MDQSGKFALQDPSSQSQEDPELQDDVDGQWIARGLPGIDCWVGNIIKEKSLE